MDQSYLFVYGRTMSTLEDCAKRKLTESMVCISICTKQYKNIPRYRGWDNCENQLIIHKVS